MTLRNSVVFLEVWLRSCCSNDNINIGSKQPVSAQSVIQSWAELRSSLQLGRFSSSHLKALETLHSLQTSLYVADPQAKLLLSVLSLSNLSLPRQAYGFIFKILYVWARKSVRPAPELVESAVDILDRLYSTHLNTPNSFLFISEGVILLGALSYAPGLPECSVTVCLDIVRTVIASKKWLSCSSTYFASEVLAGIGYALSSCGTAHFGFLLDSLLAVRIEDSDSRSSVANAVMVLHLVEWVLSGFICSNALLKIELFGHGVQSSSMRNDSHVSLIMVASGLLRGSSSTVLKSSGMDTIARLRLIAGDIMESTAGDLVSKSADSMNLDDMAADSSNSFILKCFSLGLARCNTVLFQPRILFCLAAALFIEILPLKRFYSGILELLHSKLELVGYDVEVADHLESTPFREAGAVTAVLCNQYALVDNENKSILENFLWRFCHDIYTGHRWIALMLRERHKNLLEGLEKIAESAFLMVVIFSNVITKHRLISERSSQIHTEISVRTLVSFSHVEFFRHMRLTEYLDTIRAAVMDVKENEAACISFIESMPSYLDVINKKGSCYSQEEEYVWFKDDVQTARVVFYMRVIPTCISRLPVRMFRDAVVPAMFLYMRHPGAKAAGASHSLFAAFVSSSKDIVENDGASLKEQLVFYYVERSLEGYPDISPFDAMASGVVAIVRHLPAGSPSAFYCIDQLVGKADKLCREDAELWKNWKGNSGPSRKLVELLIRLIFLVDIQVFPYLLKLLAGLIVKFPKEGQSMVMEELYKLVAESDDVTRKSTLVSWLQSLSYICYIQARSSKEELKKGQGFKLSQLVTRSK